MPRVGESYAGELDQEITGAEFSPFWVTRDDTTVRLYQGDVRDVLRHLKSKSVHCVVTSPPYHGLRDYGTGLWEGGNPECEHSKPAEPKSYLGSDGTLGRNNTNWDNRHGDKRRCTKCGATRTDRQLGSEALHDCESRGYSADYEDRKRGGNCAERDWETGCHVCRMVLVFREVRRILRDDGTCWLNYGDSYSGGKTGRDDSGDGGRFAGPRIDPIQRKSLPGLPSGNLVGVPWRVALALQADGWILRQDIIWHKPSPMPESVTNRCTKAHEYVFLLAKKSGYSYDAEAIREGLKTNRNDRPIAKVGVLGQSSKGLAQDEGERTMSSNPNGSNKRDVWSVDDGRGLAQWLEANAPAILAAFLEAGRERTDVFKLASAGYPGAHFATFPPKLIEPMIKAGTAEKGCCAMCGTPWRRVVETRSLTRERPNDYVKRVPDSEKKQNTPGLRAVSAQSTLYAVGVHPGETARAVRQASAKEGNLNTCANSVAGVSTRTVRWEPNCECHGTFLKRSVKKSAVYGGYDTEQGIPRGWAPGRDIPHDVVSAASEEGRVDVSEREQRAAATEAAWENEVVVVREYVCGICGVTWSREGKEEDHTAERKRKQEILERTKLNNTPGRAASRDRSTLGPLQTEEESIALPTQLLGPACHCLNDKIVPCTVLDPFCGSGTSCVVALSLGRRSVGIDLSAKYLRNNAVPRIEGELLSRPSTACLVPRGAAQKANVAGKRVGNKKS